MAFIVSANYRNRGSKYRWLIRQDSESADKARACKSVTAKQVRMVETKYNPFLETEEGFNCYVVAVCEEATGKGFEGEEVRLRFEGTGFTSGGNSTIKDLQELRLEEDGSMYGVLAEG